MLLNFSDLTGTGYHSAICSSTVLYSNKVKFLFIAISGICLGIFKGSHGSHRAAPEPMCLPTMTQMGHEHSMQCIRLVHTDNKPFCQVEQTHRQAWWRTCSCVYNLSNNTLGLVVLPLEGDKVSMLTHTYPHNPMRKIKVTICKITRLTIHFMCSLMSDLVICKFGKSLVIHDTECPFWDQVSLNNTNKTKLIVLTVIVLFRPYFEMKDRLESRLQQERQSVEDLQRALTASKERYTGALHNLEHISEEIHRRRRKARVPLPPRTPGVGAEMCNEDEKDLPSISLGMWMMWKVHW